MINMVKDGQIATIHFIGRIAEGPHEGEVFDTTDAKIAKKEGVYDERYDYEPISFRVGEGKVLPGIEDAVREMDIQDQQTVTLTPETAFGERRSEKVYEVPKTEFEAEPELDALVNSERGEIGWITEVEDDTVAVDFNHELAGTTIEVELWVVNVLEPDTT